MMNLNIAVAVDKYRTTVETRPSGFYWVRKGVECVVAYFIDDKEWYDDKGNFNIGCWLMIGNTKKFADIDMIAIDDYALPVPSHMKGLYLI